jgi:hypothetical protein
MIQEDMSQPPGNRGSSVRLIYRFTVVGIIALLEIAAYLFASGLLSFYALYPITVLLVAVFILSLNILWKPAMPTATAVAEVFTRGGKGALFRWTKDSLAIVVTATFLTWFVASFLIPLWYYPARSIWYGTNGVNFLAWDIFVAGACFVVYMAVGENLPARVSLRTT